MQFSTRRKALAAIAGGLVAFTCAQFAGAQTPQGKGTIVGKLVDEMGKPVSGTKVTAVVFNGVEQGELKLSVFFTDQGTPPEVSTDDKGDFRISGLPPLKWILRTQQGFFDNGGWVVQKDSVVADHVLIIEVRDGGTSDAGTIRLRK